MARETKFGLVLVVVLGTAFGALLFRRLNVPNQALASTSGESAAETVPLESAPLNDAPASGQSEPVPEPTVAFTTPARRNPSEPPIQRDPFGDTPEFRPVAKSPAAQSQPRSMESSPEIAIPARFTRREEPREPAFKNEVAQGNTEEPADSLAESGSVPANPFAVPVETTQPKESPRAGYASLQRQRNEAFTGESTRERLATRTVSATNRAAEDQIEPQSEPRFQLPVDEPEGPAVRVVAQADPGFDPLEAPERTVPQPKEARDPFGPQTIPQRVPSPAVNRQPLQQHQHEQAIPVFQKPLPAPAMQHSPANHAPLAHREDFAPPTARTFEPQPEMQAGDSYIVQPNDNFWVISKKKYGAGKYHLALAQHNQQAVPDPRQMRPGLVIATPPAHFLEQRYAAAIPKEAKPELQQFATRDPQFASTRSSTATSTATAIPTEPPGFFISHDGRPMYRVGSQDTLSGISQQHLGRSARWVQIYQLNREVITDANALKVGTVLHLPHDASEVRVVGGERQFR